MIKMLLPHNGVFEPEYFDSRTGIFRGSCNFNPIPFFNAYSIKSGYFLNCVGAGKTFPVIHQEVLNLDEVKEWVKDCYPDFKF